MSRAVSSKARLTTLATFPENYLLENLAVREDNSVLVTALNHRELWYVPTDGTASAAPILLHRFDQLTLNLTELEPDIFCLCTSNVYTDHKSCLYRIDQRNWSAGAPIPKAPESLSSSPVARNSDGIFRGFTRERCNPLRSLHPTSRRLGSGRFNSEAEPG